MRPLYKLLICIILFVWCVGIFIGFFFSVSENLVFLFPFLQKTYSLVCHQQKNKLIQIGFAETLTCARCTGIYLGLFFSSLLILFSEPTKKLPLKPIALASIPMIIDVTLASLNIYNYSKLIAFCTGFLLASTAFFYFYAGLKNLIKELRY